MRKISIRGAVEVQQTPDAGSRTSDLEIKGPDDMVVSDGYHSLDELYDHRIALYIALCRFLQHYAETEKPIHRIWRSKLHHDGTSYAGWFILGIDVDKGQQITYHLPFVRWEETEFAETLERAPEFDGHTPWDVLERLKAI